MGLRERLLGVAGGGKRPTLVIYWADTRKLLTYMERVLLHQSAAVISVTPLEVLLQDLKSGRKVVVRGITDEHLPEGLYFDSES
jgi:hypothetical protein